MLFIYVLRKRKWLQKSAQNNSLHVMITIFMSVNKFKACSRLIYFCGLCSGRIKSGVYLQDRWNLVLPITPCFFAGYDKLKSNKKWHHYCSNQMIVYSSDIINLNFHNWCLINFNMIMYEYRLTQNSIKIDFCILDMYSNFI